MNHFVERYTYPDNPDMYYDEYQIPKKNGTYRRICAPSPALLSYQRSFLEAIESNFRMQPGSSIYHGFVKNRNCVTAANEHVGFNTTVVMDIHNFFDTVHRQKAILLGTDYDSLDAVHRNALIANDYFYHKDGTLAQGFATSPMLANIVLVQTTRTIDIGLKEAFGYAYRMTVYADDIQISLNSENYDDSYFVTELVKEELEASGFKVHPHKTRISYAKYGYRKILGIGVGDNHIKPSRKVIRKIRAARHQQNGPSLGGLVNYANLNLPRALR